MATTTVTDSVPKVLLAVADGSEDMEAVITLDVLRRAGVEVTVASVSTSPVTLSRGTVVVPDTTVDKLPAEASFDCVVLPGGMPGAEHLRDCDTLRDITRRTSLSGRIAAICAAPAVALAAPGWDLLTDRHATCHPNFTSKLPIQDSSDSRVVTHGNVTTSRGPGTAFEFALALVEELCGADAADATAAPMVLKEGWREGWKRMA